MLDPDLCTGICKVCETDFAAACYVGYSDHFQSMPDICNECYEDMEDNAMDLAFESSRDDRNYGY
jgi:hypothetical protein